LSDCYVFVPVKSGVHGVLLNGVNTSHRTSRSFTSYSYFLQYMLRSEDNKTFDQRTVGM